MKSIIISVLIAVAFIGGAIFLTSGSDTSKNIDQNPNTVSNVQVVDGKQLIDLTAKGGFTPRKTIAQAGIPTVLRMNTKSTFDCSVSVRIASLSVRKNLPPTGVTEIDLGTPVAGLLRGSCGMGMYPFEIDFKS